MLKDKAAAAATLHTPSRWFASAAKVKEDIPPAVLDNVWATRIIFTLQTFVVPLAFWFKPLCVFLALFWYAEPF